MSDLRKSRSPKTGIEREFEIESAKMFGKHVSAEKGRLLIIATLLACAAPMLLGARLWAEIPEIVESGLIGVDGKDDSIPRWMVAFGLPGLMCILDLIAHCQLLYNQKRMTLPAVHIRLMGRWGFPILSVLFCSGMIRQSVGAAALPLAFAAPCVLGLGLMMLGGHMYDCPRSSPVALRFSFTAGERGWRAVHRFAGDCQLAAGLMVIAGTMLDFAPMVLPMAAVIAALLLPIIYGSVRFSGSE